MAPIITTKNLSVTYDIGKSSEFPALQDVNIEIYPAEYIIFYGPSGCGKSTLLYALCGLEVPTKGEIYFHNHSLSQFTSNDFISLRRLQIGMIFQAYNLIPTINVLDNVLLPNIFGGLLPEISRKRAKKLLDKFSIGHLANRYPGELSGGQQQRVAIARALIYWPPILFADEPVGNLDSTSAQTVMNTLEVLNQENNKTIILVTHEPFYLNYAHRVFHMKDGRIIRIVANPGRKPIAPSEAKVITTETEALARAYPHLSNAEIKAKALAQYLLASLDQPVVERLEKFIQKRISNEISEAEFKNGLDKPFEQGGAGLYKQTAQNFAQKVENILAQAKFIQQSFSSVKRPLTETDLKVQKLRRFLLDESRTLLKKEEQVHRLDHCIRLRLEKMIDRKKFQELLDLPFKQGGVGLNIRTARDCAKKIELALIEY